MIEPGYYWVETTVFSRTPKWEVCLIANDAKGSMWFVGNEYPSYPDSKDTITIGERIEHE